MAEKTDDKDIWEKLSDAASSAGKIITDEYKKLKLGTDIRAKRNQVGEAYRRVGEIIYDKFYIDGNEIAPDITEACRNIDKLQEEISELELEKKGVVTRDGEDTSSVPETITCPECGGNVEMVDGKLPNFCLSCGNKLAD